MALRKYYDGSTSIAPKPHMALACIAADEKVWEELEPAWNIARQEGGNPEYVHMTDLMAEPPRGIYKGWSVDQRDVLLDKILGVLFSFSENPRIHSCTATVDLTAHKRTSRSRELPAPERMCARIVFPTILDWYSKFPDKILDMIDAFYDQGEPFMRHVVDDWNSPKHKRKFPVWSLIRTIAPADMKTTPPLQMTDVICWGWQRIATSSGITQDPLGTYAMRAAHCLKGIYRPIDEQALLNVNWKDEGSAISQQWKTKRDVLMPKEPSEEFKRFDALMRELIHVPHSEIKKELDKEKREKARKKRTKHQSASGRASRAKT